MGHLFLFWHWRGNGQEGKSLTTVIQNRFTGADSGGRFFVWIRPGMVAVAVMEDLGFFFLGRFGRRPRSSSE
jgi:hypothetical protein